MKSCLLLALLFLAACSSTPEKSGSTVSSSANSDKGLADMSEAPRKRETAPQPLPPVTTAQAETKSKEATVNELDLAIQKQDERAIAIAARQILIQSPQDAKALNALALYHFRRGELNTAKVLLRKAIASHADISMLFSNLGIVLQASKENKEALNAYREALKADPTNAVAAANVGAYYAEVKDYNKAQVALEVAVDKGQRDWRTLNNYGVTLMALGKYGYAEPQLKKAVELQSQNTAVLLNYAILLIDHLNKPAEGLDVINKIRFIGPGPDIRKKISELENKAKSIK